MSRMYSCSVCNTIVDTGSHKSIARHNKSCNSKYRMDEMRNKIEGNNIKLNRLMEGLSKRKMSSRQLIEPDVDNSGFMGKQGAYTSQLLCGITSSSTKDLISVSHRNGFLDGNQSSNTEGNICISKKANVFLEDTDRNDTSNYHEELTDLQPLYDDPDCEDERSTLSSINEDETKMSCDENIEVPKVWKTTSLMEMSKQYGYDPLIGLSYHSDLEVKLLKLASIVTSVNAPHYIYKELVEWGRQLETGEQRHRILSSKSITFEKLIRNTSEKYGVGNIFPMTNRLWLPSNNMISVTTFDFEAQLFSLLTDEMLMRPENLIYGNDTFGRASDHLTSHVYDDVETSKWFLATQKKLCTHPKDILCPIILYIDKTYVKSKPAEPISFTLGLFKRNIRNTPMAWRNIGMIPGKLGDLIPNMNFPINTLGEMRLNDWHYVCSHILHPMKQLQKVDGLKWAFGTDECRLHIPIMFIIGDIEGHDKVCSRKSGHGPMMKSVTHSCNIRKEDCGDVDAVCSGLRSFDIKAKQDVVQDGYALHDDRKECQEQLDQLGFYPRVKNAFFDLDYGASSFGTHGACAICLLHTFKQKFPNTVLDLYLSCFGGGTSNKGHLIVTKAVPRLMVSCLRQSDRSFPKLNTFLVSLLHAKFQLNANEKYARMFALSLFLMTTFGWNFSTEGECSMHKGQRIVKRRILLVQRTMSIYKFLSQKRFPKNCRQNGDVTVRNYMSLFKEVIDWRDKISIGNKRRMREEERIAETSSEPLENLRAEEDDWNEASEGYVNNCKFPKFHYLLHVLDQIETFGSAQNFDGGACESNHKYLTKSTGKRTQGRMDTFDYQTAFNLSAKIVLDRACRKLNIKASFGVSRNFNSQPDKFNSQLDNETIANSDFEDDQKETIAFEDNCPRKSGISINKCSSHFTLKSIDGVPKIEWKNGLVKPKSRYPRIATKWIEDNLMANGWEKSIIHGFTCLDFKGNIVRAHPSYRSGDPWFDYVNVKWMDEENWNICPARVCMFLEILGHPTYVDGKYAIVHSTAVHGKQYRPSKRARNVWKDRGEPPLFQFWDMEPTCQLAHVDALDSVAFVYPDFSDEDMAEKTGLVIEVKPIEDWIDLHNWAEI